MKLDSCSQTLVKRVLMYGKKLSYRYQVLSFLQENVPRLKRRNGAYMAGSLVFRCGQGFAKPSRPDPGPQVSRLMLTTISLKL